MTRTTSEIRLEQAISPSELEPTVRDAVKSANMKNIKTSRREDGTVRVTAETDASLLSWGERISINLTPEKIVIESQADQVIDWGKTKRNVNRLVKELSKRSIPMTRELEAV